MFKWKEIAVHVNKKMGLQRRIKVYWEVNSNPDSIGYWNNYGRTDLELIAREVGFVKVEGSYSGNIYQVDRVKEIAKMFSGYSTGSMLLFFAVSDAEACIEYLDSLVTMRELQKQYESNIDCDPSDGKHLYNWNKI